MKIEIPYSSWLGNLEGVIKKIDTNDSTKLEIIFDEKWISLHPLVFTIIASVGINVINNGGTISLTANDKLKTQLKKIGLLNILGIENTPIQRELAGKYIPLTQIIDRTRLTEIIQELVPLLHCSPEQADPIKYVLSEMIRNVLEHSNSPNGAIVCAKYFKKSNRVSIGIVDSGIGILESLKRYHNPTDSLKALQLALTPGITGTTDKIGGTEYNAGAGLFFTKSIAKVSNNFFLLYSGNALYRLKKDKEVNDTELFSDPLKDNSTLKEMPLYWKGTMVGFDISLDNQKEFRELLDKIRDVYFLDLKIRKREKYKKPRFI